MKSFDKTVSFKPIGVVRSAEKNVPRHWTVSDVEGILEIAPDFVRGLRDIRPGQRIVVLFWFHRSASFTPDMLVQTPSHRGTPTGVFSICSPRRPNPIGLSVVQVLEVSENRVRVRGIDMVDGTPVLDIKPHIETV